MDPQTTVAAAANVVTDPLLSQATASAIAVWLLERAKRTAWFPFLTEQSTAAVQRLWGIIAAVISAAGINYTFNSTEGTLLITGLTSVGITGALWAFAQSFTLQQFVYHGIIKSEKDRTQVIDRMGLRY
jgi:hypothetical protein